MDSEQQSSLRLPEIILPMHYDLDLSIDPSLRWYSGDVKISIDVRETTDTVVLNSSEMTFNLVQLTAAGKVMTPKKTVFVELSKQMILSFDAQIPVGMAQIEISFKNKIEENMQGIYRTSFNDDEKKLHECVFTFFVANDASSAFPCFDEPGFKATFKVSITYLPNKTVISNAALERTEAVSDGFTKYFFKPTPKMSTYLLAFAIGDFGSVSRKGSSGITISVYGPFNMVKYLEHALGAAESFVDFYHDFFQISYPMEKLDLIAVPSTFMLAMENWGLITFREDFLYLEKDISSSYSERWTNLAVAHELAHQWFGNLVTMKWWTDIWLNEGFANWIIYAEGLELDSYSISHPVEVESQLPSYLMDIFDAITYSKGASLNNFMYHFVGHQHILNGLREYMSKFQFGSVSTDDLWGCLEKASNKPVSKLIGSFTRQPGYPLIHIEYETSSKDSSKMILRLRQERYLLNADKKGTPQTWVIPIDVDCIQQSNITKAHMLLEKKSGDLVVDIKKELKYVLLNPKRSGFFRVFYSERLYEMLLEHLSELDFEDRFGLLCDYYSFARSGLIGTDLYLDLVRLFSQIKEEDEEIWKTIIRSLNEIHCLISFSPDYQFVGSKFKELYLKILVPIFSKYQFTADTFSYDESRMILVSTLMKPLIHYDQELRDKLLSWFDEYAQKRIKMIPDFRRCMFQACYTSQSYFEKLLKYFESVELSHERVEILEAACSASSPSIVAHLYEFSLSKLVKPQEGVIIYETL
ncbi:Puromycin-sensitive aminopeptidase [Thelohanellus kitauei]|uniref:Aminopeptidase n=1 Tax=Thelohanellus kitauei TaxID=669202 RepID=A0A0C2IHU6_THEKT|nr:Puromycin-sensitive aminopeptidase [Thelohanellus kitauei]